MKWILLAVFSMSAQAESWKARGLGAEFYLVSKLESITFNGRILKTKIAIKDCNRDLSQSFMNEIRAKLSDPTSFTPSEGIHLELDGKSTLNVKTKSSLGIALLTMEDRFQRFKLTQESLCSSSR